MTIRHALVLAAVISAPLLAAGQQTSMSTADAKVGESIKAAISSGKLTKLEGGELKLEQSVRIPGDASKVKGGPDAEVLYQIGITKEKAPVFLPVRTQPSESAEAAKAIDQILSASTIGSPQMDVQACAGERTCAKVCGTPPNDYCCKWKCDKVK